MDAVMRTRDASTFYANRALRLYPAYLFVLICAILASLLFGASAHYMTVGELFARYRAMDLSAATFLVLTNLTVIGQDWAMFLHIDRGALAWTPTFYNEAEPAYRMLVVPQAWSIGTEISFYLFAPLLTRLRSSLLVVLIALSFAARVALYSKGIPFYGDPWNYRYFPLELPLFLVGGLMYRASKRMEWTDPRIAYALVTVLLVYVLFYSLLPDIRYRWFIIKYDLFLILLAVSLPFLHTGLRYGGLNKVLGEMSYPIYLNHLLVYNLLTLPGTHWGPAGFMTAGIIASIALALLMTWVIEEPIDRIRQRIARQGLRAAVA